MIDLVELKERQHLTASLETMKRLHEQLEVLVKPLDEADRNLLLRLLECMVLGSSGRSVTLRFGHNVWSEKKCSVCGVPLDAEGHAFWMLSRWEPSSIMLNLCDVHGRETFKVDFDLLTGSSLSEIAPC